MSDDKKESLKELLDDDEIRNYFQGRDPNRAKPNPFLTEETAVEYKGKSSTLKPKEDKNDETYGVSFTQHAKHVREIARHFLWIGMAIAFVIAIIIATITGV